MKRFNDKAAIVTGAASGIGRATVERLAREGARVLACDVNAPLLHAEVKNLANAGLSVTAQVLDVSDAGSCAAAVAAAVGAFGRLDVLCNVAGTLLLRNFLDTKQSDWLRVMAINLNGVFLMSQAAMPHLLETRGNIVNVASTAGVVGIPYGVAYSASKFGVVGLTKALAAEVASSGATAQPAEIAGAIAYLASPEAAFVTGSVLVIDAGQTAI